LHHGDFKYPKSLTPLFPKAHFFARMHAIFDLIKDNIMFGKGGLGGLMKQAQQMQEKMQKIFILKLVLKLMKLLKRQNLSI